MSKKENTGCDDETKKILMKKIKDGDIKFKDIPARFREEIFEELCGRKPIKRFQDIEVINK